MNFSSDTNTNTNTENLNSIIRLIFSNKTDSTYKLRFGDLYNKLYDYLIEGKFTDYQTIVGWESTDSFISSINVCLICCLKTFTSQNNQKEIVENFIEHLTTLIENYDYEARNYDQNRGQWIRNMFKTNITHKDAKETKFNEIPSIAQQIWVTPSYYNVQRYIYVLFNLGITKGEFHNDYINFLTIGTVAFVNSIFNKENRNELMESYLKNLYEMSIDEVCFYDVYHTRTVIEY